MLDGASDKDRQIGSPPSDIEQPHPQLQFLSSQDRLRRSQGLKNHIGHIETGPVATPDNIMNRRHRPGDNMDFGLQPNSGHSDGILDFGLAIHHKLLGQNVDNLLILRYRHRPSRIHHSINVILANFPGTDGDQAMRIKPFDVTTGNSHENRAYFTVGHLLGLFHRPTNRTYRAFNIDHHPAAQTHRRRAPHPDYFHLLVVNLGHHHTNFGGPNVQTDQQLSPYTLTHIFPLNHYLSTKTRSGR